ncbi:bacterial extracellular solute-binding s, 3 family protein, partial [Vibrio parahaemolyticus AQ3810]
RSKHQHQKCSTTRKQHPRRSEILSVFASAVLWR